MIDFIKSLYQSPLYVALTYLYLLEYIFVLVAGSKTIAFVVVILLLFVPIIVCLYKEGYIGETVTNTSITMILVLIFIIIAKVIITSQTISLDTEIIYLTLFVHILFSGILIDSIYKINKDYVILRIGKAIYGRIIEEKDYVIVDTDYRTIKIPKSEIIAIAKLKRK